MSTNLYGAGDNFDLQSSHVLPALIRSGAVLREYSLGGYLVEPLCLFHPTLGCGFVGWVKRIRGSHHIFTRDDVVEILNLQPKGHKAKAYQVKQVRDILVKYRLGDSDVD